MRLRLEAEPGELRDKGRDLVKAIATRVAGEDPQLAKALARLVEPVKAYVSIPIPPELATDWPEAGRVGEDASPPHFTVLYIGEIDPVRRDDVLRAIQVAIDGVAAFRLRLASGVSWFTSHEDKEIAHKSLAAGAGELTALHQRVRVAVAAAGFAIKHAGRDFTPHATLGYLSTRIYPPSWPVPEGMFDADSVDVGFSDGDVRRFMLGFAKADDATYQIAAGSQMGNRAVNTGSTGLNIASFSPVQLKPDTSSRMRERVEGQLQTDEELAFQRQSMKPRKEGLKLLWTLPERQDSEAKVFDLPQPTHRDDTARVAIDNAPAQKRHVEANAARYRGAPSNKLPAEPALMLPASYAKAQTLRESASAPAIPSVNLDGPLGVGASHTVTKRGVGSVTLTRAVSGYQVVMDGFDAAEFKSLSAACDHVWAKQKGYDGAAAYKDAMQVNKVPSGAGWKFWGLHKVAA